jgi:hypothetical protein
LVPEPLGAERVVGLALHALAHLGDLVGAGFDAAQQALTLRLLPQDGDVRLLGG